MTTSGPRCSISTSRPGADRTIADGLDKLVQTVNETDDDDGAAGSLVPVA
jgi:hypothetical protein